MEYLAQIPYAKELAETGLLGILLVISLTGNIVLVKLVLDQMQKRIDAATRVGEELVQPLKYIRDALDILSDKVEIVQGRRR